MRFFDDDAVGCYLDAIGHRVEKTDAHGNELKVVDLTLRVQPFTPALAVSLDPEVRALLFGLGDAEPKRKIKALHFNLACPRQQLTVTLLPEEPRIGGRAFLDVEISDPRARTQKGIDGYGFVFYATIGPVSAHDLEYICAWHTEQRFVTFDPMEAELDFGGAPTDVRVDAKPARRRRASKPTDDDGPMAGDVLRPGVHAEH